MSSATLKLYSYWRSSSAYRVRLALELKRIHYENIPVNLIRDGGEQHREVYRGLNPLGLVPCLVDDDFVLTQSLAMFHYLEARFPEPSLVPPDARDAARMWALASVIACDTQPLQNLSVFAYLAELGQDQAGRDAWARHWIGRGLDAFESLLPDRPQNRFCTGAAPSFADCTLLPQLYNARRFGLDCSKWPRIVAVAEALDDFPEVRAAHPDRQPDSPSN